VAKNLKPKANPRSRIVGHDFVKPEDLLANPLNYRRHPQDQLVALKGSINELGWVKAVIVNKTTGFVLDGHARVEESMRMGIDSIPVTYVELSPDEERKALALLDPITNMAYSDDTALKSLIDQISFADQNMNDIVNSLLKESIPNVVINGDNEPRLSVDVIKQITVFYDEESYNPVVLALLDYSEKNNCADNSEALKSLLREKGYEIP